MPVANSPRSSGSSAALVSSLLHATEEMTSVHAKEQQEGQSEEEVEDAALQLLLEKRAAMNLIIAIPYAIKHALRHEPGCYCESVGRSHVRET